MIQENVWLFRKPPLLGPPSSLPDACWLCPGCWPAPQPVSRLASSGAILYYNILYYDVLQYTILYYTILYYAIPYHTIPYHTNTITMTQAVTLTLAHTHTHLRFFTGNQRRIWEAHPSDCLGRGVQASNTQLHVPRLPKKKCVHLTKAPTQQFSGSRLRRCASGVWWVLRQCDEDSWNLFNCYC